MVSTGSGLVCAYLLNGGGGGKPLVWDGIRQWKPKDGILWVHLERDHQDSINWLKNESGVNKLIIDALTAEETRPRLTKHKSGVLMFLRGVNLAPGADPEDMVSIRLWIEDKRIISIRLNASKRILAVSDVRKRITEGTGPKNIGDMVVMLSSAMFHRIGPVLDGMEDALDKIEDHVPSGNMEDLRHQIGHLRVRSTKLRRYVAPQREVMSGLCNIGLTWIDDEHKAYLHENYEHLARYVESLDMIREHASIIQDEITNNMSERINRNMFILAMLTAVFLPLGFLTGLFGINIGGLPGVGDPYAFSIFMASLVALTGLVSLFLKIYFLKKAEKKHHGE